MIGCLGHLDAIVLSRLCLQPSLGCKSTSSQEVWACWQTIWHCKKPRLSLLDSVFSQSHCASVYITVTPMSLTSYSSSCVASAKVPRASTFPKISSPGTTMPFVEARWPHMPVNYHPQALPNDLTLMLSFLHKAFAGIDLNLISLQCPTCI